MIVLVAADDDARIARLTEVVATLFPSAEAIAMRADQSTVDIELAWGTRLPAVEPVDPDEVGLEEGIGVGDDAIEQPLPAVGDSAVAIEEAALRCAADIIVVASDERGWFSRAFNGSATGDLVRQPPVPVLVVPLGDTGDTDDRPT